MNLDDETRDYLDQAVDSVSDTTSYLDAAIEMLEQDEDVDRTALITELRLIETQLENITIRVETIATQKGNP